MSNILVFDREEQYFPKKFLTNYFPKGWDGYRLCMHKFLVNNLLYALTLTKYQFLPREDVEENERFLQPIPYCALTHKGNILFYRRVKSGDNRLSDKFSIGFGGHIEEQDDNSDRFFPDVVMSAAVRELTEELGPSVSEHLLSYHPKAILYDDSNPVGRVHLGLVYFVNLPDDFDLNRITYEDSVGQPTWSKQQELRMNTGGGYDLETWSELILDGFFYESI